jgi:hypothetical protein
VRTVRDLAFFLRSSLHNNRYGISLKIDDTDYVDYMMTLITLITVMTLMAGMVHLGGAIFFAANESCTPEG